MKGAPDHVSEEFRSERLLLRRARLADAPEINAAVIASLAELGPWFSWAREAPTLAESTERCRLALENFQSRAEFCFHLYLLSDGRFAGKVNLVNPNWEVPCLEIGYWLRSSLTGQGLAREAVTALCDFAWRELAAERLEIRMNSRNLRSRGLAEALGFQLEGVLRHQRRNVSGELADTLLFAKLRGA